MFLFGDLNGMEYVEGDYFINFFKGDDGLTELVRILSLHIGKEYDREESLIVSL